MRIFLTGATGFVGSRITKQLLQRGHKVLGLCRSDVGARWLLEAGAEVHRGTLEDPQGMAAAAATTDAVIHTAFDHDFSRFLENTEKDRRVIVAMGEALMGTDKPFIITSGTGIGSTGPGIVAVEDVIDHGSSNPRVASELAGAELLASKVSVAMVRLPQVHDTTRHGLISPLIPLAKAKRVSAYVGDGMNRWPSAHVQDVAELYILALEQHVPGARWHAVAEEGIHMCDVADVIARGLGVPVASLAPDEAAAHFGALGAFAGLDLPASSKLTRERLGWEPSGPGLLADLAQFDYRSVA